jgi:hypothetical protein
VVTGSEEEKRGAATARYLAGALYTRPDRSSLGSKELLKTGNFSLSFRLFKRVHAATSFQLEDGG